MAGIPPVTRKGGIDAVKPAPAALMAEKTPFGRSARRLHGRVRAESTPLRVWHAICTRPQGRNRRRYAFGTKFAPVFLARRLHGPFWHEICTRRSVCGRVWSGREAKTGRKSGREAENGVQRRQRRSRSDAAGVREAENGGREAKTGRKSGREAENGGGEGGRGGRKCENEGPNNQFCRRLGGVFRQKTRFWKMLGPPSLRSA